MLLSRSEGHNHDYAESSVDKTHLPFEQKEEQYSHECRHAEVFAESVVFQ